MYNVSIQGLPEVLQKIESYSKELADGIDNDLSTAAKNTAALAIARAPFGRTGQLKGSIRANTTIRFSKTVSATVIHAPYVEFGTGLKVFKTPSFNFTPEMRAYAREFYVSGRGREPAQPFLFPSLEIEKVRLINRIKERLFKNKTI